MTIHTKPEAASDVLLFNGTLVDIQLASQAGADRISVIRHRMPYRASPPMHVHRNEDEVFHVVEGTMRFRIGNEDIVVGAGRTVLAPKGIPHSFRVESREGATCLTITRGDNFETMVRETGEPTSTAIMLPLQEPDAATVAALTAACARNGIDIVGAPIVSPALPAIDEAAVEASAMRGLALPGRDVFTLPTR